MDQRDGSMHVWVTAGAVRIVLDIIHLSYFLLLFYFIIYLFLVLCIVVAYISDKVWSDRFAFAVNCTFSNNYDVQPLSSITLLQKKHKIPRKCWTTTLILWHFDNIKSWVLWYQKKN